jgi:septal ring factor EnvC (AmiA/AmiB activator)
MSGHNEPQRLDIHLYVHQHEDTRVHEQLDRLIHAVDALAAQERHMANDIQSIKQLVTEINDETNTVAARIDAQSAAIQALKDQIAAGTPVSQADLDAIAEGLAPISERLKALGQDSANPIPPVITIPENPPVPPSGGNEV